MSEISMTTSHALGTAEAQRRLKAKLATSLALYGSRASELHEDWSDGRLSFGFKVLGANVTGTMVVEDRAVRLSARVPLGIALFRRVIERRIRLELGDLLS